MATKAKCRRSLRKMRIVVVVVTHSATPRVRRAERALQILEQATTACPYCGSFKNRLLKRGKARLTRAHPTGASTLEWTERRRCVRCPNVYTIRNGHY